MLACQNALGAKYDLGIFKLRQQPDEKAKTAREGIGLKMAEADEEAQPIGLFGGNQFRSEDG